jgi:hypothetical protein
MDKSSQIACLIALNAIDDPREFTLVKTAVLVGSDPANDLVVRGETVSRRHATIEYRDDRYEITDLSSTNGTFVNNQRVTASTPIKKGHEIRFGQARFVLWVMNTASEQRTAALAFSRRATMALFALAVVLSVISGFIAGGVAATRIHGAVIARRFVLVDQDGKPRGFLAVFPQAGDPNCRACGGKAHLVVLGKEGEPPQIVPSSGPALNLAELLPLIKLLGALHGLPLP